MNECSVSNQSLSFQNVLNHSHLFHPLLKASSSFRWRSCLCSVRRVALYSLSHGQMGLSAPNVLFKRLWGWEEHHFHLWILALVREWCSEEVLPTMNLQACVSLTLIHSVSRPSWGRGMSARAWLQKELFGKGDLEARRGSLIRARLCTLDDESSHFLGLYKLSSQNFLTYTVEVGVIRHSQTHPWPRQSLISYTDSSGKHLLSINGIGGFSQEALHIVSQLCLMECLLSTQYTLSHPHILPSAWQSPNLHIFSASFFGFVFWMLRGCFVLFCFQASQLLSPL